MLHRAGMLTAVQWRGDVELAWFWRLSLTVRGGKRAKLVRWFHPINCRYKLNVDGASKAFLRRAGGGAILRGAQPSGTVFAFSKSYEFCPPLWAEMMAMRDGLRLCYERGIKGVEVESDSLSLVQRLRGGALSGPCLHLIMTTRNLIQDVEAELSHVLREANGPADWLANYVCASNEQVEHVWDSDFPFELIRLVNRDVLGVPYLRI